MYHELYERNRDVDVVKRIQFGRLRWAGHLPCMSEDESTGRNYGVQDDKVDLTYAREITLTSSPRTKLDDAGA